MSVQLTKGVKVVVDGRPYPMDAFVEALAALVVALIDEELQTRPSTISWRWLTTEQAAELLGVSRHRIAARVREGQLPGRTYNGRTYVDREELEKAIDRGRIR